MDMKGLVEISRFYGEGLDFAVAGGGNTSIKDDETLAVKASGIPLRGISENGFVLLSRAAVRQVLSRIYSTDPFRREAEVKADLLAARLQPERGGRPSVESSLHEMIEYRLVVHTHPFTVNALLCAANGEAESRRLFGDDVLFIPYTDPGYTLARSLAVALAACRKGRGGDPHVILMQNHGLVVAADTAGEIQSLTEEVLAKIRGAFFAPLEVRPLPVPEVVTGILPALRMMLSGVERPKILSIRNDSLIEWFLRPENRRKVSLPFTPDNIVYCGVSPLVADFTGDVDAFLSAMPLRLEEYRKAWGSLPRVLLIGGLGMAAAEDSKRSAETALDMFGDMMRVSALSESFGGPRFLSRKEIEFITSWEVESYRSSVAKKAAERRLEGRIAVVTGAAQGFGKGIAEGLFHAGANVVVADVNEAEGRAVAAGLNAGGAANGALFVAADVTRPPSLDALARESVKCFGGVDLVVSNAGVLRAGGLDELAEETFDFVTRVNYTGYFLCVKHLSPVMKLQHRFRSGLITDIIQINSKSGLEGSNKNFAYAGSKFGGIGLTQSFALELVEHGIKVNSICPGNFFEGPLWSDPENGLFVQYLRAGKVPGAKSIQDVKAFYESRVPMGRGCRVEDVVRAILYLVEQEYETGQALPVTGGQVMLS
jgi:NAD(P)-dependent dehydrogenase (short-subunit alcohol dehydrogenase family)/rhamnose utilization protein RhaD (predicted bifunctional aldolase and dehydrogenase)